MTRERETFGNIPPSSRAVFYILAAAAVAVFAYGIWRRFRLWRRGTPVPVRELFAGGVGRAWEKLRPGARRLVVEGLGQKRVLGRGLPSRAHILLFSGFMILLLGTTLLEINHLAEMISKSLKFHRGAYYIGYEATLDFFGLLFLAGTVLFFWRRLRKPASVGHRATDWYVLASFVAIGVTGYLVEGLRIVWDHPEGIWAKCSPVGLWIAGFFSGLTDSGARSAHLAVWWVHAALVFGFIASIPYTRLLHMVAGPLNLFLARPGLGVVQPVSLEDVERTGRIGASEITHFSGQQLLSLDACMECGRCEEACPAFATGKPLSPKKVVQDLKGLMVRALGSRGGEVPALHGGVIRPETLWACTACSACVEVCPVRIDPLTLILDMRRHLVAEGGLSGTAATALRRMQSSANPWGLPQSERAAWAAALSSGEGGPSA
jgi:heterodisulfide reductase subunit C/nitrate reductase gamma subunit